LVIIAVALIVHVGGRLLKPRASTADHDVPNTTDMFDNPVFVRGATAR